MGQLRFTRWLGFTNKRAHRHRALSPSDRQTNRTKSAVRAKVEHPFLTLKRMWGFMKVRYRGLAKNANRAYAMLALINVSKWGRALTGEVSTGVSKRRKMDAYLAS